MCRPPRPKTESVEGRRNQGDDRCGRASPRCIELARIDPAFTLQINMFKPSQVDFLPSNTWLCCESSGRKLLERKSRSCWTFELLASWKMEQPGLMTFWWNKHGDFKMQTTKKSPHEHFFNTREEKLRRWRCDDNKTFTSEWLGAWKVHGKFSIGEEKLCSLDLLAGIRIRF